MQVCSDALNACLGTQCEPVPAYVTVSEPTYTDQGNYLGVWLQSVDRRISTRAPAFPRPRATYGVKLIETGWPTLEASAASITAPEAERMHALAEHSYAHAESILRAVYGAIASREFSSCNPGEIGSLRPQLRTGGLVGWQFAVVFDPEW